MHVEGFEKSIAVEIVFKKKDVPRLGIYTHLFYLHHYGYANDKCICY